MATRRIISEGKAPIRQFILGRPIINKSHANGQVGALPVVINSNQTDRLLRPTWEPNQMSRADVTTAVEDRFSMWFRQASFEQQSCGSARGRQIPADEEEDYDDLGDGDEDELDDEMDDFDDDDGEFDDDDNDKDDEK